MSKNYRVERSGSDRFSIREETSADVMVDGIFIFIKFFFLIVSGVGILIYFIVKKLRENNTTNREIRNKEIREEKSELFELEKLLAEDSPWNRMMKYIIHENVGQMKNVLRKYEVDLNQRIGTHSLMSIAIFLDLQNAISFLMKKGYVLTNNDLKEAIKKDYLYNIEKYLKPSQELVSEEHLNLSIQRQYYPVIYYFIQNFNFDLNNGPIEEAIKTENMKIIKLLVKNGAVIDRSNNESPYHIAKSIGNRKILKYFDKISV